MTVAVYLLFIASGFTGLAYEIVWTRMLVRVFGATSFAVTTVLASYMAGLALGSYLFGRLIDRKGNPIRVYGLLELGIGLFALAFPFLMLLLNPFYSLIYPGLQNRFHLLTVVRFILCFGILLIPTTLMGGTLPVLSKFLAAGLSTLTERVGRLYAVNTIGAVVGAFGTGFFILPRLGIRNTTWMCAALNFAITALALALAGRPLPRRKRDDAEPARAPRRTQLHASQRTIILISFLVTGFCALSIEVIWTRVLSLVIGTTVYAFATMLATFLLGLALGSAVFARIAQRTRHPGRLMALVASAIGLTVLVSLVAFSRLPVLYMLFYENMQLSRSGLAWIQFLLCSLTMIVPTFLMGGLFPLVTKLYATDISRVGSEIGAVYAFNTVGAILGSVAGSLLFLRFMGIETSVLIISCIYIGIGGLLMLRIAEFRRSSRRAMMSLCTAALVVAVVAASPPMDRRMLTSGVYRYAPIYKTVEGLRRTLAQSTALYYDEGVDATVTVERIHDEMSISIDGKVDASTGIDDMTTQVLLAQLPLLMHPDPDTVLVIGLGSGVTLGSAETHPIRSVDCVELLENVVEASGYLNDFNNDCLSDPRARLIIGDGRNHLLLSPNRYDVIISEPTNPWISGVGDLFTREFFELARQRLKPDGIMCAWFHTYHMDTDDLKTMARTFLVSFPEASLWMLNDTDVIFLGSAVPLRIDDTLGARMREPGIADDLRRIWVRGPEDLLSSFISDSRRLRLYGGSEDRLHTDDNMMLEFSAGAKVLQFTEVDHLVSFLQMAEPPPMGALSDSIQERVRIQVEARKTAIKGSLAILAQRPNEAIALFEMAYADAPTDPYVLTKYIKNTLAAANALYSNGRYDDALRYYQKALVERDFPTSWTAYLGVAAVHLARGEHEKALGYTRVSIEKNPHNADGYYNLGKIERLMGDTPAAIAGFKRALEIFPHASAARDLSRLYLERRDNLDEALRLAKLALSQQDGTTFHTTLGWVYHELGQLGRAERAYKRALDIDGRNTEALYRLSVTYLAGRDTDSARRTLERLVDLRLNDYFTKLAQDQLRQLR